MTHKRNISPHSELGLAIASVLLSLNLGGCNVAHKRPATAAPAEQVYDTPNEPPVTSVEASQEPEPEQPPSPVTQPQMREPAHAPRCYAMSVELPAHNDALAQPSLTPTGRMLQALEGTAGTSLQLDPRDSAHLMLATQSGTIYQSHDAGDSWQRFADFHGAFIPSMLVDATRKAGRGLLVVANHQLYRTVDGGTSWSTACGPEGQVDEVLAAPGLPSTLFARVESSVYRSTDAGDSWSKLDSSAAGSIDSLTLDSAEPGTAYGVSRSGIYSVRADSDRFEAIAEFGQTPPLAFAVDPHDSSIMFVSLGNQVQRSQDGGATWQPFPLAGITGKCKQIQIDARDSSRMIVRIYRGESHDDFLTTDGGQHFAPISGARSYTLTHYLLDPNIPARAFWTDATGVYRTDDAFATRSAITGGIHEASPYRILYDTHTPGVVHVVTEDGLVHSTQDFGQHWTPTSSSTPRVPGTRSVLAFDAQLGITYASHDSVSEPLRATSDGGRSWQVVVGAPSMAGKVESIGVAASDSDALFLLGSEGAQAVLHSSHDRGATWTRHDAPGIGSLVAASSLDLYITEPRRSHVVTVNAGKPSEYYTTTYSGPTMHSSHDGGQSWSAMKLPYMSIAGLVADAADPNVLYLAGSNSTKSSSSAGLRKSTDGGLSWSRLPQFQEMHGNSIHALRIDPASGALLLGFAVAPLFQLSTDHGLTFGETSAAIFRGVSLPGE